MVPVLPLPALQVCEISMYVEKDELKVQLIYIFTRLVKMDRCYPDGLKEET